MTRPVILWCGLLLVTAIAVSWALPDPLAMSRDRLAPPSLAHWFGTDPLGRDVAARLWAGLPASLGLALTGLALSVAVALATSLSSAWSENRLLGFVLDGAAQALLSFPPLWLPLIVLAVAGRGPGAQVFCVGLVLWADLHWILRGEARRLLAEPFVEAARGLGFGAGQILWRDVLPNLSGACLWLGLVKMRQAVILLASLAFLGLGSPPPAPTWGLMIADSRDWFLDAPWLLIAPTAAIAASLWAAAWIGGVLRSRFRLERLINA